MAVQQNKPSRSKKKKRRSHDTLSIKEISTDLTSGEIHLRHHITTNGYYRGRKIINK